MQFHLPASCKDSREKALEFARMKAPLLLRHDAALWTDNDAVAETINNRLGWLDGPEWSLAQLERLTGWADTVRARGVKDVVLLGMGGSSLAPEVCAFAFGPQSDRPSLHVLDNTHPNAIRALEARLDLDNALFIVASKSGSTIETRCFFQYFFDRKKAIHGNTAGDWFVAITDDGSDLQRQATEHGFSETFVNPTDIGGRYSALSFFGLVPAAACGFDVSAMLKSAVREMRASTSVESPAIELGALLGTLAQTGRNKLTLVASEVMKPLGVWIEQLVAESTGKENQGIVPITNEQPRPVGDYGTDRVFAVTRTENDSALAARAAELAAAGHPVIEWIVSDAGDLGQEFFRWEVATAIAGAAMGINPFDEPNVTESKNKTGEFLERVLAGEAVDAEPADGSDAGLPVWGTSESVTEQLKTWKSEGDYLALLAYGPTDDATMAALEGLRDRLGTLLNIPATLGIGPRFLHSTGQLHKGGDASGIFVQVTSDSGDSLKIPGEDFDFGQLNVCQALGDLEVLRVRGRRVLRVHAGQDLGAAGAIA